MEVWKMKGRHELTGFVAGTMYLVKENEKQYFYLINSENPSDIYVLNSPTNYKFVAKIDDEDIPLFLRKFHENRIKKECVDSKKIKIKDYWVHDKQTTKFVLSEIGPVYHDVVLDYSSNRRKAYLLDKKWRVSIDFPRSNTEQITRSVSLVENSKDDFGKAVNKLMIKTDLPWDICKFFADGFSEEEACKVLFQIKKDIENPDKNYFSWYYWNSYSYIYGLNQKTGVGKLMQFSISKRNKLFKARLV